MQELAGLAPVLAEHDVLGDGERRNEAEVLVHHADPGVDRLARRREDTGSPYTRISPASGR